MNNQIVTGSLSAISQRDGVSLAESFMSCDAIILLDLSGSMEASDTPTGQTRRMVATQHLIRLQKEYPGKVALICFADYALFCPAGIPQDCGGSTRLDKALEYVKIADDAGMKIIVISDGSPNDPEKCLKIAKTFINKIDVIFVGSETDYDRGRKFLEELAKVTGGKSVKSDNPGELFNEAQTYLLKG
jgi:Mg-chelatase subunit ChlD